MLINLVPSGILSFTSISFTVVVPVFVTLIVYLISSFTVTSFSAKSLVSSCLITLDTFSAVNTGFVTSFVGTSSTVPTFLISPVASSFTVTSKLNLTNPSPNTDAAGVFTVIPLFKSLAVS